MSGEARTRDLTALDVRPATSLDVPFVISLAARFGSTRAPWRDLDEVVEGTRRQLAAAFNAARDTDAVLVAVNAAGERFGFVYVVTQHDFFTGELHGHVSEVATVSDQSGAGSALMAAAEAWSRERDSVMNAETTCRAVPVPEYRHLVKLL